MDIPADVTAIPTAEIVPVEGDEGVLGRGALGEVRRGRWVTAGGGETGVALKRLFMLRDDAAALAEIGGALSAEEKASVVTAFLRECVILSRANHPNILPFYGIVVDEARQPLYMATALVESGTLRDMLLHERYAHLRSDVGGVAVLSHALVVDVLLDVFLALEYLHTRAEPVIHRDVKPANILVVFDPGGKFVKAMLADLGEAKQVVVFGTRAAQSLGSVGVGTLIYMAPEMKEEDEMKGPRIDTFSLGVAAAEIASGRCPAPGPEMRREGRRRVAVPEEERRAEDIRAVANDDLRAQVIQRCITDDPAERADAAEMVAACRQLQRTPAYQAAKAALEPAAAAPPAGGSLAEKVATFASVCETDEDVAQICLANAGGDLAEAIRVFLAPPPPAKASISVETPDGVTLTLEVSGSDNIGSVKAQIQAKGDIPVEVQRLSSSDGQELSNDGRTLAECNIQSGSRLIVHRIDQVCFQAGTLITMSDGTEKPIEKIAEGDSVLSWDHQQNTFCRGPVVDVFSRRQAGCIVEIATKDADGNHVGRLTCTSTHPFWTVGNSKHRQSARWAAAFPSAATEVEKAAQLRCDDELLR